jgi:hypothetical protein
MPKTTTPPEPEYLPETAPDGHTWLSQETCEGLQMWAPPDPQQIPEEWPAWRLPAWFAGRTGLVQVPGQPGQPGVYQYVWSGWLPWQSFTDRIAPEFEWPDAELGTVAEMQADVWPAPPETPDAEPVAEPETPGDDESGTDAPPLTDPIPGPSADSEGK